MRPFIEAIRPLVPFVTLFIITTVWVIFSRNDILSREPRILFLLFGTVFSNISVIIRKICGNLFKYDNFFLSFKQCRLIVAQMSDTRADAWNNLMCLIIIVGAISIFPLHLIDVPNFDPNMESFLVYFLASVATLTHFHYGYGVVSLRFIVQRMFR